jgi:proteasome lid subunit RPN8/RPN11
MSDEAHLTVPRGILEAMLTQAREALPHECIGLLAGSSDGRVTVRYPLVNAAASPTRFESEPRSLLDAERRRREAGLELLAVYHSHPGGPAVPSRTDTDPHVNLWIGSDVLCVIIAPHEGVAGVRAYRLAPHRFSAVCLEITEEQPPPLPLGAEHK